MNWCMGTSRSLVVVGWVDPVLQKYASRALGSSKTKVLVARYTGSSLSGTEIRGIPGGVIGLAMRSPALRKISISVPNMRILTPAASLLVSIVGMVVAILNRGV